MTDDDDKKSADCTNDFLQSMDDIAILDDVGKKTRRRHRRLASHVLPEMVIQRALGVTLLRRLKTDKGRPVVVSVSAPGADWCKPLSRPIRNWNAKVIVRDGSVRMENATMGSSDVNDALADGNHVFGISHAPERLLPATLTLVADARVETKIPDGKMIRSLISRCVGRPPKVVPDDVAAGLSFDDIVSAFRPRATPAQVVAALAAASAARCRVSVTDATPPLTDTDEERSIVPCHPAPPTIVCALDDEDFAPGSMAEANWRLASMLAITVLVGDSSDLAAVPAAIWFAKDTQRAFRTVDPLVAEIDFLSWCDLGRDLSAWFDVRFTTSRQHMI
jgi:hypothetical protein